MSAAPFPNAEAELAVPSLRTAAGSSTATEAPDEPPVPPSEPQGEARILILSQERGEATTEVVMDWIHALGGRCSRLNGEDLSSPESYSIRFGRRGKELVFHRAEGDLKASDVGVVWFRRWHRYENLGIEEETSDPSLVHRVESHLRKELGVTFGGLCSFLKDA
ncbi:MAG: hypothetical protein MI919_36600, partial [Holophagales bacterium]|nr:hypothetical protein [Holophagales bacterium]